MLAREQGWTSNQIGRDGITVSFLLVGVTLTVNRDRNRDRNQIEISICNWKDYIQIGKNALGSTN